MLDDGTYNSFPGLASVGNKLHLVYRSAANHNSTHDGHIYYRTSTDDGATWTSAVALTADDPTYLRTGPTMLAMSSGRLLCTYTKKTNADIRIIESLFSTDGGANWAAGGSSSTLTERTAGGCPAIEASPGVAWLPVYGRNVGETRYNAGYIVTTDGGVTWGSFVPITVQTGRSANYEEPCLLKLLDGSYLCMIRVDDDLTILSTRSTDGVTWPQPSTRFQGHGLPATYQFATGAITTASRDAVDDHSFTRTNDNGGTEWWASSVALDERAGMYVYAAWAPLSGGRALCVFSHEQSATVADLSAVIFGPDS